MKRLRSVLLAFLAGIMAPILIWAGLFVVIRKPLLLSFKRVGAMALAFSAGILAPVLVWVGLIVAVKEHVQVWRLHRAPGRTVSEILADAGLTLEWKTAAQPAPVMGLILPVSMSSIHKLLSVAGLIGYSDAELLQRR